MHARFVLLVSVAALAGCGGDGEESTRAPATTATVPVATAASNLGCDVAAQCFPQLAEETLKRCPPSQLSPRARDARRRLERLLARIADVDLHNEQAYEASDAVLAALAELEQVCR